MSSFPPTVPDLSALVEYAGQRLGTFRTHGYPFSASYPRQAMTVADAQRFLHLAEFRVTFPPEPPSFADQVAALKSSLSDQLSGLEPAGLTNERSRSIGRGRPRRPADETLRFVHLRDHLEVGWTAYQIGRKFGPEWWVNADENVNKAIREARKTYGDDWDDRCHYCDAGDCPPPSDIPRTRRGQDRAR